jgi:N6-adenosine-specific RNA methylase IME4
MIPDGLEVLKAWGFSRYITSMVWVKEQHTATPGAILPMHETVLVAARGQGMPPLEKGVARIHSWHRAAVTRHSQKPTWFAQEIERVYPKAGKLEMFARSARPGWIAWGNQANGIAANDDVFSRAAKTNIGRRMA